MRRASRHALSSSPVAPEASTASGASAVERKVDEKRRKRRPPDEVASSADDLGACLRTSFPAENHDSLGDDITRLMLHLSRQRGHSEPHPPGLAQSPSGRRAGPTNSS